MTQPPVPTWPLGAGMRGQTLVASDPPRFIVRRVLTQTNSLPVGRSSKFRSVKLSPQAHEPVALGLSMVKPCFSIVSTKSMVAPIRYGALIRSVTTSTPPKTLTMSPSKPRSSKNSW